MKTTVPEVPFGPNGNVVYDRTYSRTRDDGTKETWPETVRRVARGNLALVYGNDPQKWADAQWKEYADLCWYMGNFALLPAGRHLWATGVPNREYLFNCHVAGWGDLLSEHFSFSFLRLMEGGGVGANYSGKHTAKYGAPVRSVALYLTSQGGHQDMEEMEPYLSQPSPGVVGRQFVEDSREGWADALADLIDAFYDDDYKKAVRWYDVNKVRPSGSELKTFGGTASGPAPLMRMLITVADVLNNARRGGKLTPVHLMEIDHAIAECVVSGGNRRSARMSIVAWNDPHVFEFLRCKQDTAQHWTTNISVEIDNAFLHLLSEGDNRAKIVHEAVVKAQLANGEPGYWNSSKSQEGETGLVIATNPCGEIALEPYEPCNLGHVNMDWFARTGTVDWKALAEAHRLMTRFLVRATYGDVNDGKQAAILAENRRIGVGHLGVQGYWAKQGVKYSDIPDYAPGDLTTLYNIVRREAREYAFKLRIPEPVKVTAIAPTGTIAKLPGVTEGIHPVYARWYEQRVRFSRRDAFQRGQVISAEIDGYAVEDDVYDKSGQTAVVVYPTENILVAQVRELGLSEDVVQSADQLTIRDMLAVQRVYQEFWADNAVSYTCNIPEDSVSVEELTDVLAEFLPDLKGTTIMVDASRPQAPYKRITKEEYEAYTVTRVADSTDEECSSGACPIR